MEAASLGDWDAGNFTSFRGLPAGGSFYLRIVDTLKGDVGTVRDWAVHVRWDRPEEVAVGR
ncbi:hypothetical protein K8I85_10140 [bacterium]|nr:hypothetical protein [bacterium]